jgi:hypothetical protein
VILGAVGPPLAGPPVRPPGVLRREQPGGRAARPADPGAASRLARVAGGRVGQSRKGLFRKGRLLRGARGSDGSFSLALAVELGLLRVREHVEAEAEVGEGGPGTPTSVRTAAGSGLGATLPGDVSTRYDAADTRGDEEQTVAFLAQLAGQRDALEFAVGTGRIALPLMRAGVHVDGIEISPAHG